jgi:hypothetical protein
MIDAERKFEVQTGFDRFQKLAKTKNHAFRFRLYGVARCPRENDQQNDHDDSRDRPHRNVWHLESLKRGTLINHRVQLGMRLPKA